MLDRPVKGFPLPVVIDPPKICIQFEIPNEQIHIANFLGNFLNLAYWFSYQRDDPHTGLALSQVWMKVYNDVVEAIQAGGGCVPTMQFVIWEENEMAQFKTTCENGVFKAFILECSCPEKWVELQLNTGSSQAGNGAPQPQPGGGKATYQGCLTASGQYLIPTSVSTGDVISVTALSGAWNDPDRDGPIWRCPDGELFLLGLCAGAKVVVASDPLNTVAHMAILIKIGSTYLDASNGPVTVPGGITSAQAVLVANDGTTVNDNGSICFDVTVTNNTSAPWKHLLDFSISPYGFTPINNSGDPFALAIWTAGVGFVGAQGIVNPTNNYCDVLQTIASCHIDSIELTYGVGTSAGGANAIVLVIAGVQTVQAIDGTPGTPKVFTWIPNVNAVTNIEFVNERYGSPAATNYLYQAKIIGSGIDPFPSAPTF